MRGMQGSSMTGPGLVGSLAAVLLLAACGGPDSQGRQPATSATRASAPASVATPASASGQHEGAAAGTRQFRSARLGFSINYPQAMDESVSFDSKYLANDDWKTYAPADSSGSSVVMLTLPDSNKVTAGELRVGVSSGEQERSRCTRPPSNADPDSIGKTTIGSTTFQSFHAADAAMNHYLKVHSYRTVHDGYCYAIDLLVTGTNPEVYDPPRKPPFSNKEAFAKLHKALEGFRFLQ